MAAQAERISKLEKPGASRYHVEIDVNSNSTHATILRLAGENKRVLELGCATGHMSRILRDRGCEVTAIEIDATAAQRASAFCERVVVGDLDHLDLHRELGEERFDVAIAADVLEHLKEPAEVLRSVKNFLRPDGCVVVSIPNVAHMSVRLALLSGRFPYAETGLLDRTHLRFFTRESLERLFDEAGFTIGHFQRMEATPPNPAQFDVPYDPASIPPAMLDALSHDPEASTYQFVVVGYPLPRAGLVFIQERTRQMAYELEVARRSAAELRTQLDQVSQLRARELAEVSERGQQMINDLQTQLQQAAQMHTSETAEAAERGRQAIAELQTQLEQAREFHQEQAAESLQAIHSLQAQLDRAARSHALELAEVAENARALDRERTQAEGLIASLREDAARKQQQIDELSSLSESGRREAGALRGTIEEQNREIAKLRARVETLFARERDLREMLLDAHDQLLRRDEEIAASLATAPPRTTQAAAAADAPERPRTHESSKYLQYRQMLQKIRDLVREAIPQGGNVLAISRGDDDLLRLDACRGSHFPQGQGGVYAGYHPANSGAAIAHLKDLEKSGSQFLLIPQTALWWLEHYPEFADYLNSNFRRLIDRPDVCVLFDLGRSPQPAQASETAAPSMECQPEDVPSPAPFSAAASTPFGVNVCGHISSEKGTGESARATIRALTSVGIPVALNDFRDATATNLDAEFTAFAEDNPYAVNLIHANADALEDLVGWKTERYFQDRYNIGYWAWELARFPKKWLPVFNLLNEVWVPSTFVLDSVSRVASVPVVVIPHSLPKLVVTQTRNGRSAFGLPKDKFLFLFMFDFMSILERKNPLGLIQAFKKAFKNRDNAMLVLKVSHAESCPAEWKALEEAAKNANIKIINGVLSRPEVTNLLSVCDCYVSLHRSEGFGLTLAEAMSLAKPVIATGYSGNMDFMTPTNSFPVKYGMIPLEQDYPPYDKGSAWADPSQDHAAELMQLVYEKRKLARDIGRQAQKDVQEKLSIPAVGAMLRERFATLVATGRIEPPEDLLDVPAPIAPKRREPEAEYRRLIRQTQRLVRGSTPEGATVMVISKGDDDLLKLEGRRGWHFPLQEDGAYAGFHPRDSVAAIGYLEMLRAKGGEYLLIPRTSFWWLEYYADFRRHLESSYRKVKSTENGVLYELLKQTFRGGTGIPPAADGSKRKVNGAAQLPSYA
jgi:2-polyprenyl-3-methyl-5-hydroxy-6-metoxy-1,4-benzoquinol methylase/glycosyltransferase involved in cell wall biosynthesis